jgi:hypothetical protein
MIKANELRIGNWIKDLTTGEVFQVHRETFVFIEGIEDQYEPIPLTPEIFLSCGFIEGAMLDNSFISNELPFDLIEGHYYLRNGEIDNFSRPIDFLHQLQNINLDLTGEELEIKELQQA